MTTSAIPADVQPTEPAPPELPAAEPAEPAEPALSPRDAALAIIAAGRREQFEAETGVKLDAEHPAAPADVDPAPADPIVDQLAAQLAAPEDDLASRKVKVKIDGEESEVAFEELRREYQKGKSADKRLTELARRERALEERERATNTPAPEIDPELGKQFTTALANGDGEAANQAFADAVSRAVQAELAKGRAAIPDTMTIAQQVKQQLVVESALEQSHKDYPQLYADPDLEALGATKIQRKMQDEALSFTDALKDVTTEFAAKFGWVASGRSAPANPTTARDAKLERKAGIDNLPAINVKSTSTEAPPSSPSDVIAEMRRQRGQV